MSDTNSIAATSQFMASCSLCPRNCHVDRRSEATARGYCGMDDTIRIARAALHFWEEPGISAPFEDMVSSVVRESATDQTAVRGSGAVFFSGCTLRCVYCQNREIAAGKLGRVISIQELADIFVDLQNQGAYNINLVTPTHYVPQIREAILLYHDFCARTGVDPLPMLYNTSSYENLETLQMLDGLIDIYLPDLKYLDPERSAKYSHAKDYPEVAKAAIAEMVRQTGAPVFDDQGLLKHGTVVRHLVLPGATGEAKRVTQYLYETYGHSIYISILHQYTPISGLDAFPELQRRVTKREYQKVVDYALELGVEQAFTQEGRTARESFIPEFSGNTSLHPVS